MAQRGAFAVQPSRCCCSTESTLTTTPSISYGSASRFSSHSLQNATSSFDIREALAVRIHLEAQLLQCFQRFPLGRASRRAVGEQEIREVIELPRGRDGRIQHAQRSGRRVARIREQRLTLAPPAPRSASRTLCDSSPLRRALLDFRDVPRNGSGMQRMVRAFSVTSSPIAPSPRVTACASLPVAIVHRHRQAVQLQLGHVGVRFAVRADRARAGRNRAVPPRSAHCPGSAWDWNAEL